ncbi:MAG: DUF362 domain-containing protein [Methanomicrobiales archaeon]|nr:DUF362 domain-containing protein [Methanomicrobiales archaeon]
MSGVGMAEVFVLKTTDRTGGITQVFEAVGPDIAGKAVVFKANYNSADPFPASTYPDTLQAIANEIMNRDPISLSLIERSGMGSTRRVLEHCRVYENLTPLGVDIVVLDDLPASGWSHISREGTHWRTGFSLPKQLLSSGAVVQTCCLKTHRFGGHFTLSLKNSVGLVAKTLPGSTYDYMHELHSSPFQRQMIAEINRAYPVDAVIMDAVEGFASGGPEDGKRIAPGLLLGSRDRVAIDAAGVALLRSYGSTPEVMNGRIYSLDQIARAAELGVGCADPREIELIPLNEESRYDADRIAKIIREEG